MLFSPRYRALVLAGKTTYGELRETRASSNFYKDHLYKTESVSNSNDSMRFTRLTKLCLDDDEGETKWSPNHSDIPLLQITHLDIQYKSYSADQLLEYLDYLPNVHSLVLPRLPFFHSKRIGTIHPSMVENKITKLVLGGQPRCLEGIRRLCRMLPRLEYLKVCIDEKDFKWIARYLLSKCNSDRPQHLCCLFLMNMNFSSIEDFKKIIHLEVPFFDYTAECANGGWYLWW